MLFGKSKSKIYSTGDADSRVKLLAEASLKLIEYSNFTQVINDVLAMIGQHIGVNRVYIFEDSADGKTTSNTYEWCKKGTTPQIKNLQNVDYQDIIYWKKTLAAENRIMAENIKSLPKSVYNILEPQGIKSILVLTIRKENQIFGFIGFDDTENYRQWNKNDIYVLEVISSILSNVYLLNKAEEKLKKSAAELASQKEYLDLAVQGTKIGTWEWKIKTGETIFNERWAEILGYSLKELVPTTMATWKKLTHPEDYRISEKKLNDYFQGKTDFYECEVRMKHKNGHWVWVLDRGMISERDIKGNPIRMNGTHQDMTERKQAEVALIERENNFRTLFNTIGDLLVVATVDGKILFVNDAYKKKLGYTDEEFSKMNVLELNPSDKRKEAEKIFTEMFKRKRDSCPLPLVTKKGTLIPAETRVWFGQWGGVECVFGLSKDLSREQEMVQKFERLFNNNPSPMALSAIGDGKFNEVNEAFLKTLGYQINEVIGKTSKDLSLFVKPEQQKELARKLKQFGHIENEELLVRKKDGTILNGIFYGEIIISQGKEFFLTVMIDNTERKIIEEKLKKTVEELQKINSFMTGRELKMIDLKKEIKNLKSKLKSR